jgi:ABC-type amino acid transport substrate-binding protein
MRRQVAAICCGAALLLAGCVNEPPALENGPSPSLDQTRAIVPVPPAGASKTIDWIRSAGYVPVGVAQGLPYVGFDRGSQQFFGVMIDFANLLADQLGVTVTLIPRRWSDIERSATANGGFRLLAGGPNDFPELDQKVDYLPIDDRGFCIAVRSGASPTSLNALLMTSAAFAVVPGSDPERVIRLHAPDAQLRMIESPRLESSIEAVADGRAEAAVLYSAAARFIIRVGKAPLRLLPADCETRPLWPGRWGVAVLKDDPVFRDYISVLIAELVRTGWFHKELAKWLEYDRLKPGLRG